MSTQAVATKPPSTYRSPIRRLRRRMWIGPKIMLMFRAAIAAPWVGVAGSIMFEEDVPWVAVLCQAFWIVGILPMTGMTLMVLSVALRRGSPVPRRFAVYQAASAIVPLACIGLVVSGRWHLAGTVHFGADAVLQTVYGARYRWPERILRVAQSAGMAATAYAHSTLAFFFVGMQAVQSLRKAADHSNTVALKPTAEEYRRQQEEACGDTGG
jgi:hypothetical protein